MGFTSLFADSTTYAATDYWQNQIDGGGTVNVTNESGENYSCYLAQLRQLRFRKGWNYGTANKVCNYNVDIFAPFGNGYLSFYEWTKNYRMLYC